MGSFFSIFFWYVGVGVLQRIVQVEVSERVCLALVKINYRSEQMAQRHEGDPIISVVFD
jgi:hypothetical protein